jgi:Flp pilus assembly protein TadD
MSNQLNFLLNQALLYINSSNFSGAELLLKQIIKVKPNHSEALRLSAVISAQEGHKDLALETIEKAILADKRNGIAYSNRGNIQLSLGMLSEAISSYEVAIKLTPSYAEAYSNLGNAYQELGESIKAIDLYKKAISIDQNNPEFFCNLGNALWRIDQLHEAKNNYETALSLTPDHTSSQLNLAHLNLLDLNFRDGWRLYEARWQSLSEDRPIPLKTSKPFWDGKPKDGFLLIWGEQGIGDQILYASMLTNFQEYPQTKIISVDKKLIPIFERSFPNFNVIDKNLLISEDTYDEWLPMGSLGRFFRNEIADFRNIKFPYLRINKRFQNGHDEIKKHKNSVICGVSWKGNHSKFNSRKSMELHALTPILTLKNVDFISLQNGDISEEVALVEQKCGTVIKEINGIDIFDDIDALSTIIELCDLVITTSNSVAHLAGALGKETLLLLSCGNSRFWYWQDVAGCSLWYPSVKIFKQSSPGDWIMPIQQVKTYLENRVAI